MHYKYSIWDYILIKLKLKKIAIKKKILLRFWRLISIELVSLIIRNKSKS